jgi:hypothetical protein
MVPYDPDQRAEALALNMVALGPDIPALPVAQAGRRYPGLSADPSVLADHLQAQGKMHEFHIQFGRRPDRITDCCDKMIVCQKSYSNRNKAWWRVKFVTSSAPGASVACPAT